MTDDVRNLIRFVVDGDIRNAQTQCRIMLEKNVPEKDARFKENELRKLNLLKPELIQLPANLENLLIAEDATNFPESRFLLREEEETVINKLLAGHSRTSAECSITQSARLVFFVLMKLMPSECAVAAAMMSLK